MKVEIQYSRSSSCTTEALATALSTSLYTVAIGSRCVQEHTIRRDTIHIALVYQHSVCEHLAPSALKFDIILVYH